MDRRSFLRRVGSVSAGAVFASLIGGCGEGNSSAPMIMGKVDYGSSEPEVPARRSPIEYRRPSPYPRKWYPEKDKEKTWRAVIVHHSATDTGSASVFHQWHKYGRGWDGIGYDFVIGNGTGSGDGEIEVTYRWRTQVTGAHCKANGNWANEDGIGICLVGNFNNSRPSSAQLRSLGELVAFLQKRYGITDSRVYGHYNTPGVVKATDCPGRNFPWSTFKRMMTAK